MRHCEALAFIRIKHSLTHLSLPTNQQHRIYKVANMTENFTLVPEGRSLSSFVFDKQVDRSQDFEITFANDELKELLQSGTKSFEEMGIPLSVRMAMASVNLLRPSKIQSTALPLLLNNPPQNLIAQAQTGTGKTAAFILNILHRIDASWQTPQAIILSPTRELARQTILMVNDICAFGIGSTADITENVPKTQLAIPGEAERAGKIHDAQIIVGTPGTILSWIRRRALPVKNVRVLVVDEADNMLDGQGLGEQCIRVKQSLSSDAQICLFSATFPEKVRGYANDYAPPGSSIFLRREELTVHNIRQILVDVKSEEAKFQALVNMYHILTIAASIIFCKTRVAADRIKAQMEAGGHKVSLLHAGLETGAQRDAILDDFRCGRTKVMITTNVLARGFDMSTVSLVVNYDLPRLPSGKTDYDTYLHRVGRTGRFGRAGVAISFVHDTATWREAIDIQNHFGVPLHWVPGDDIDDLEMSVNYVIDANKARGKSGQQKWTKRMNTSMDQSRHAPH